MIRIGQLVCAFVLLLTTEAYISPAKCVHDEFLLNLKCKNLESIPNLRNIPSDLKTVDFSQGEIDVIEANTFRYKKLLTVTVLLLRENHLFFIEPGAFDTFLNLKELDLSNNILKVIPRILIDKNKQLKILNLSKNLFSGAAPLISSTSLQMLDLSHSKISSIFPENLHNLPNLLTLNLKGNAFKTLSYDVFQNRPNLRVHFALNNWECNCKTIQLFEKLKINNQSSTEDIICMHSNKKYEKIIDSSQVLVDLCEETKSSFVTEDMNEENERKNFYSLVVVVSAVFLTILLTVVYLIILKYKLFTFEHLPRPGYNQVSKL